MIYFDNAATSKFKPKCVLDVAMKEIKNSTNPSRGNYKDSYNLLEKIFNARNIFKKIVNANSSYDCIFTPSCTFASNLAILGYIRNLNEYKGKNIVISSQEHNSTARPVFEECKRLNIELRIAKPHNTFSNFQEEILNEIDTNTLIVCINQMSNVNSNIIFLEKIGIKCKNLSIPLMVDAAQSLGHIKVDLIKDNISFLSCAGHKGLHGLLGTGFLIYNKSFPLSPIFFGGTGSESNILYQPNTSPEGFEVGSLNAASILACLEGSKWTYDNFDSIKAHNEIISYEIINSLSHISRIKLFSTFPATCISFEVPDIASGIIGDYLNKNNIAVRTGLHCSPLFHEFKNTSTKGLVRVSIGLNNNLAQVKILTKVIKKLCFKAKTNIL